MARSSLTLSILQRSGKAALDGSCKRHSSILSSISTFDFKLSNQSSNQNCFHSVANNGSTTVYSHNVIQSRFSSSSPANSLVWSIKNSCPAGSCDLHRSKNLWSIVEFLYRGLYSTRYSNASKIRLTLTNCVI